MDKTPTQPYSPSAQTVPGSAAWRRGVPASGLQRWLTSAAAAAWARSLVVEELAPWDETGHWEPVPGRNDHRESRAGQREEPVERHPPLDPDVLRQLSRPAERLRRERHELERHGRSANGLDHGGEVASGAAAGKDVRGR